MAPSPAATQNFHILSLSGGGCRGIFQARFLEKAASSSVGHLYESFDLIAATSTGAIVGLAIAAGKSPENIVRLYRTSASRIFRAKRLQAVRKGGRYDIAVLRSLLEEEFGSMRMSDLLSPVLIATSVVDTFDGHLFTRSDDTCTVVEIALATCAAPTYFPPTTPSTHSRSYMDGGLWANDPSFLAIGYATANMGIDPRRIHLLAIGTGKVEHGETPDAIQSLRTLSLRTLRFLFDFNSNLQGWSTEMWCRQTLTNGQIVRVNPHLREWIGLGDAKTALERMPPLADREYDVHAADVQSFLTRSRPPANHEVLVPDIPFLLRRTIAESGITKFVPARKYYGMVREGRESITSYVSLAVESLTMVSINLATGSAIEDIISTFADMIARSRPLRIRLSLLDPDKDYLMKSIAPRYWSGS